MRFHNSESGITCVTSVSVLRKWLQMFSIGTLRNDGLSPIYTPLPKAQAVFFNWINCYFFHFLTNDSKICFFVLFVMLSFQIAVCSRLMLALSFAILWEDPLVHFLHITVVKPRCTFPPPYTGLLLGKFLNSFFEIIHSFFVVHYVGPFFLLMCCNLQSPSDIYRKFVLSDQPLQQSTTTFAWIITWLH